MIDWKRIIIHHSATVDGRTFSWSAIKRYHTQTLGFQHIGYHAGVEYVDDDYFAIMGRPWDMVGAHAIGQNDKALGLCIVGNYDNVAPDDKALELAAEVVRLWMKIYNIPLEEIHMHREYANKTCPGTLFPWKKFLEMCRV